MGTRAGLWGGRVGIGQRDPRPAGHIRARFRMNLSGFAIGHGNQARGFSEKNITMTLHRPIVLLVALALGGCAQYASISEKNPELHPDHTNGAALTKVQEDIAAA